MATSFTDALSEARRRAILTGMLLTNQEIAGLTNGWFNAQAQLANSRRANQLAQDQLAENRRAAQAQLQAADNAANMQLAGNIAGTGISTLGTDYLKSKTGESLIAKGYDTASNYLGDAVGWAGEKLGMGAAPDLGASAAQMSTDSLGNAAVNTQTQGGSLLSKGYDAAADYLGDAVGWAGEKLGMSAVPDLGATAANAAAGTMEAGAAGQAGANAAANAGANAAGEGMGAGFSSYLGPAGVGFAAPGLLNAIHEDSTENLGHNLTLGLVQDEGTAKAVGSAATGAAAGAVYGSIVPGIGNVVGAVIGGAAGLIADLTSDTWICTATAKYSGMKPEEEDAMLKLKKYASEKHRGWWNFYFKHGNGLVYAVMQSEGDMPGFYANIRKVLVEPVCRVLEQDIEAAFQIYMFVTRTLFMAYMPQLEIKEEEL